MKLRRAWGFLRKPWVEQRQSIYVRWARIFPAVPLPFRLPFGAYWLARHDDLGIPLLSNSFETAELRFVEQLLRPGMTVLDLGAHHGLYTLLASKRVGDSGRVFSFEPSPRERKALKRHLKLNRCRNVSIQEVALGSRAEETDLHVVENSAGGCNSLRQPNVEATTVAVRIRVERLDDVLAELGVEHVDFIKLDVEGGEKELLKGAELLLGRKPRPVILAEVQDVRTAPWGYAAREIIQRLHSKGFRWYAPDKDGSLQAVDANLEFYDGNFVAWPEEVPRVLPTAGATGEELRAALLVSTE